MKPTQVSDNPPLWSAVSTCGAAEVEGFIVFTKIVKTFFRYYYKEWILDQVPRFRSMEMNFKDKDFVLRSVQRCMKICKAAGVKLHIFIHTSLYTAQYCASLDRDTFIALSCHIEWWYPCNLLHCQLWSSWHYPTMHKKKPYVTAGKHRGLRKKKNFIHSPRNTAGNWDLLPLCRTWTTPTLPHSLAPIPLSFII